MHLICKTTIAAALAFACCCGCQKTEKVSASAVADAATACCAGQAATCSTAQKAACTAAKVQPAAATDAAPCCASQKKVAPAATSDAKKAACTAAKAPTAQDRTVRADYAAAREKMKAMVANGEITEEQMEQRLNRMAVKIRGDQGDKAKVQPAAATDAAPCCASQKKVAPAATSDAKGECPFSNR